jgi:hypothetical protein
MLALPGVPVALVEGGRAVYFPCEQTGVIQESTLGNSPPDLLVTGDKMLKYTARPPQGLSHFRAGLVEFYGMNEEIILALWGTGVGRCTNGASERGYIKKGYLQSKFFKGFEKGIFFFKPTILRTAGRTSR